MTWRRVSQVVIPPEKDQTARRRLEAAAEHAIETVRIVRERAQSDERRHRAKEADLLPRVWALLSILFTFPPHPCADVRVRLRDVRSAFQQHMRDQIESINQFAEGAVVFVMSRQWFDAISGTWWKLHPTPYCGDFLATPCSPEATAQTQFLFAAALVPIFGLIKHLLESVPAPGQPKQESMGNACSTTEGASLLSRCLQKTPSKKLVEIRGFDKVRWPSDDHRMTV